MSGELLSILQALEESASFFFNQSLLLFDLLGFFLLLLFKNTYLTVLGLSCSTQDLLSLLWHAKSFEACGR